MYDDQGTDATWKQNIPFGRAGVITGDAVGAGSATATPDVAYSSACLAPIFLFFDNICSFKLFTI